MASDQPIIIIKKKGGHGGHHGGAWKVAYADFGTAMMALFIVLWLMSSSSKQTQEVIAGYFRDPHGTAAKKGSTMEGKGAASQPKKEDLSKLKEALMQSIFHVDSLKNLKGQIEVTLTNEGLRIELLESKNGTFFETGSAQATPVLVELLKVLAAQIGTLPNKISVEGHTDAQPYSRVSSYGNWELSSDRANMARRLMQASGVRADQISQVRGFADQRLRKPDQPFDASNRRISLIVQYVGFDDRSAPLVQTAKPGLPAGAAALAAAPPSPGPNQKPSATAKAKD